MSSRALDFKAALFEAITDLPALAGLQIKWGFPVPDLEVTHVVIGDITWNRDDWSTDKSREEEFKIDVFIRVGLTAGDAKTTETAAMGYSGAIEDYLQGNPGLGLGNIISSSYDPGSLRSGTGDEKFLAQVHGSVTVSARF